MFSKNGYVDYNVLTLLAIPLAVLAQSCSNQEAISIAAGEFYNTTIPSAHCYLAELQYSDGNHSQIAASPSSCLGSSVSSNLTLGLRSDTPVGSLNLTLFFEHLATLCYTFEVRPPTSQRNTLQTDTLKSSCMAATPPFPTGGSALSLGGMSGSGAASISIMMQPTSSAANASSPNDLPPSLLGAISPADSQAIKTVPSSQADLQSSSLVPNPTSAIPSSNLPSDQAPNSLPPSQVSNQDQNSSPSGEQSKSQTLQAGGATPGPLATTSVAPESTCSCPCPCTSMTSMR